MDANAIVKQLEEANRAAASLSEEERSKVHSAAHALTLSTESDGEALHRITWQALEFIVAYIAEDMGVFRILSASDKPLNLKELSEASKTDPELLVRILRPVASLGIVDEAGNDAYAANRVTRLLAKPEHAAGLRFHFDLQLRSWQALPPYLKNSGYQDPDNNSDTPLHRAFNEKGPVFNIFANHPNIMKDFNIYMGSFGTGRVHWQDLYPVEERIAQGISSEPEAVSFVDVGGGNGHQGIEFRKKYSNIPGKVIVQDTPHGLENHAVVDGVDFQAHDFFTPQPIKNARVYYLRWILHDYPDSRAEDILRNLHDALKPGYSKLIINEWIVPERGATWPMVAQDLNMMSIHTAKERTEEQWRSLLARTGYEVVEIYKPNDTISEGVIEAKKAGT